MNAPRITFLNVIVVTVIMAVLAAILYPVFATAKEGHRRTCNSNIKQLATAVAIYRSDSNDRFPPKTWHDEIYPYCMNEDLYTCLAIRQKKLKWGLAMNYKLMGIDDKNIKDPATMPMIFEIDALAQDVVANIEARALGRHGRGSFVAKADSSVRFFSETKTVWP